MTTDVLLKPGPVRLFDAASGAAVRELPPGAFDCQIDPRGRWAVWCPLANSPAAVSQLRDLKTGALLQTFPKADKEAGTWALPSPDGTLIAFLSNAGRTHLWRLREAGQ